MTGQVGLSFKEAITSFLEITIHTILCIRQVYPATTFTRRRAHGVPVYQSRHPQVREYISEVVSALSKELSTGSLRRVTVVIKRVDDGLPLERFLIDLGYLGMDKMGDANAREAGGRVKTYGRLIGAPGADELSLMLRGFLIRLMAVDGQLEDNRGEPAPARCRLGRGLAEDAGELTFAIIIETKDDLEPGTNQPADGVSPYHLLTDHAPWQGSVRRPGGVLRLVRTAVDTRYRGRYPPPAAFARRRSVCREARATIACQGGRDWRHRRELSMIPMTTRLSHRRHMLKPGAANGTRVHRQDWSGAIATTWLAGVPSLTIAPRVDGSVIQTLGSTERPARTKLPRTVPRIALRHAPCIVASFSPGPRGLISPIRRIPICDNSACIHPDFDNPPCTLKTPWVITDRAIIPF